MKNWKRRPASGSPPPGWAQNLQISPLLLELLWQRGLQTVPDLENYLSPRLAELPRPADLAQALPAAATLADAIGEGRRLLVWGDYDVDGISAATLVLDVLEAHGIAADCHLPDRRSEGYGLNIRALEEAWDRGTRALLTVDCGITSNEAIARARELGMIVIVSDHHLPGPELPRAHAICNPRIAEGSDPRLSSLAGVGVAFYLMAAFNSLLAERGGKRYRMDETLDLVTLGTVADLVPLVGANRILVKGGLESLGQARRPGVQALKSASGLDVAAALSAGKVSFGLAPRINAAGRMGDPELALRLLREKDHNKAMELALRLDEMNTLRKQEEECIFQAARQQAAQLLETGPRAALVLHGEDWHPGIIGIVASRIVEEFNRPAVVLCDDKGLVKGSGRSLGTFDLHTALDNCSGSLLKFGGHTLAAGLELEPGRIEEFREKFESVASAKLGDQPLLPSLTIDRELGFGEAVQAQLLDELELMQPFGLGNPEPVFASPPLLVLERASLGKSPDHARLRVRDEAANVTITAKAWRLGREIPQDIEGRRIRLAYTLRKDFYNGVASLDLGVRDWRPA